MTRKMLFSLPGMMRELSTTVSPGVDAGVLVVVHGGAAQRAHGLALGAADQNHQLLGREVAHLAGIDDQPLGNVDVAQVLRNLGALHHGAANNGHLAPMLAGQVQGNPDAVDRRGEATEEELLLGAREDLVQARNHGRFSWACSRADPRWSSPAAGPARRACRIRQRCAGRRACRPAARGRS